MVSMRVLNKSITFLCLVGLSLSIYAYVVELQIEKNKDYVAMCDISEHISCTKAFKSEYGKGFGWVSKDSFFYKPNSLLGILFYSLVAILAQSDHPLVTRATYWLILLSNTASLYFAYVLYFLLHDFCVVCVATYTVNMLNLCLSHLKCNKFLDAYYKMVNSDTAISKKTN